MSLCHCGSPYCAGCPATETLMEENAKLRAELDIYKKGGELLGQDRENAIAKMKEAEAEKGKLLLQNEEMKKALGLMLEKVLSETQYPHAFETCTAGYYPLDKCVTCGVQKMLGKGFADKRNDEVKPPPLDGARKCGCCVTGHHYMCTGGERDVTAGKSYSCDCWCGTAKASL